MSGPSELVSGVTNLPFPQIVIPNGGTCAEEQAARVSTATVAPTVFAPSPVSDGDTFAVLDVDGNAAANNITVDGNGHLIDGAATKVLSTSGVQAVFCLDAGQWRQIIPYRSFSGAQPVPTSRLSDLGGGGGGGGGGGSPNAILYENPGGTAAITDAALTAAPLDPFARPQLRDIRQAAGVGAVWREGAWQSDGDPTNVKSEGIVLYGANALGTGPTATDGGYNRQKADRIGLAQVINGVAGNALFYYVRLDATGIALKEDTAASTTFLVTRATGKTRIGINGGSLSSGAVPPNGAVVGSPGDLYFDTANGTAASLWVKETGVATNTGWVAANATRFDGGAPLNLRANRPANQSPIDNTKNGIVNLSSDTTAVAPGALADFGTIAGGDANGVSGDYGAIGGGVSNVIGLAAGFCTIAGGVGNTIGGGFSQSTIGGGSGNVISGLSAVIAGGQGGVVSGNEGAILCGEFCTAGPGNNATVINGQNTVASGNYSVADGFGAVALRPGQHASGLCDLGAFGGSQRCELTMRGRSDNGVGAVLTAQASNFNLEDGHAYIVEVSCVANKIGGGGVCAAFQRTMLVHATAGAAVIDQDIAGVNNALLNMGTGWTLVMTNVGADIVATFTAGVGEFVNATLTYKWSEQVDIL